MSNSSSSFICTGIEPNPDISGIGVRVAIYAQALLSILYPIFFVWDGEVSKKESKTMSRISINIIVTACALLVSTGIQAATFGISLYHALIILQLSWINSMTFMTVHFVSRAQHAIYAERNYPGFFVKVNVWKLLRSREALVSSLHFIVVGGIGLWVWNKITTFGDQPECNEDTFLVILSRTVYVTHGPAIRGFSLALYGILVIPFVNIYITSGVLGAVSALGRGILCCVLVIPGIACFRCIFCFPDGEDQHEADIVQSVVYSQLMFYFAISGMATTMIILIANTEQMIHRSSGLVKPGEGDWTFGQTLALLLLCLPVWEAVRAFCGMDGDEEEDV
ncbi:hypothetical protein DFH06DRAFT_1295471 [Mycena polygramma]|nr:hypothetical protein DFH06DRAFT_1295471 [Mycena polygramma]